MAVSKNAVNIPPECLTDPSAMRQYLEQFADAHYRRFASSLVPDKPEEQFLGIRLPVLRRIAVKLSAGDWKNWLSIADDGSLEEVMLQGMVIGYGLNRAGADDGFAEAEKLIRWFLPKIDNWSVCDSFCSTLKIARKYPEEMWEFILSCIQSKREYDIRFGAVMMLDYYADEAHMPEALKELETVDHDSYYVKMAVAWAVSVYYVSFPYETEEFLKNCRLDDFTYNKALQKICESRRVDKVAKNRIRAMKRGKKK